MENQFSEEQILAARQKHKEERDAKNHRHRTDGQKIGRNDYCWCGSGRKSKHCHNESNAMYDPDAGFCNVSHHPITRTVKFNGKEKKVQVTIRPGGRRMIKGFPYGMEMKRTILAKRNERGVVMRDGWGSPILDYQHKVMVPKTVKKEKK